MIKTFMTIKPVLASAWRHPKISTRRFLQNWTNGIYCTVQPLKRGCLKDQPILIRWGSKAVVPASRLDEDQLYLQSSFLFPGNLQPAVTAKLFNQQQQQQWLSSAILKQGGANDCWLCHFYRASLVLTSNACCCTLWALLVAVWRVTEMPLSDVLGEWQFKINPSSMPSMHQD